MTEILGTGVLIKYLALHPTPSEVSSTKFSNSSMQNYKVKKLLDLIWAEKKIESKNIYLPPEICQIYVLKPAKLRN